MDYRDILSRVSLFFVCHLRGHKNALLSGRLLKNRGVLATFKPLFVASTIKFDQLSTKGVISWTESPYCPHVCKTFGRQVYNMNSENSELALVKLMELFNHSSVSITKHYLGLRQEEILKTYDCLTF